jgi:hypothetical protein
MPLIYHTVYHGAGHTKEYCAGYEEGYNYDSVALNEW